MKKLLSITALALGLVSCSGCTKKDQATVEVPVAEPAPELKATLLVKNDNLEVALPSTDWESVDTGGLFNAWRNVLLKNLVILSKDVIATSSEEHILSLLREIKSNGSVIKSTEVLTINGHAFILINSFRSNVNIFMWISTEKGVAYMFSCGGAAENNQHDLCYEIAQSIKY
jgi:hypothetical protein